MRGDGQVVVVDFAQDHGVEVLPALELTKGRYWICDTNNGGRYKEILPSQRSMPCSSPTWPTQGVTRELVRMAKRWQS
jgi:hypothetical protein